MQFARIKLNGIERGVFAFAKWSASVFAVFGRNKKAPDDEQAVRFACYDGRPVVWATDGHALVMIEAPHRTVTPHSALGEQRVLASSVKTLTQKARVSQTMLFTADAPEVYVVDGVLDLIEGAEVEATLLGSLDTAGPCTFGVEELEEVRSAFGEEHEHGAGQWQMSSRFASLYAAVAKATGDADAWCLNPPRGDGPLVVRVPEGDATWSIVVMPLA
jgi:hypothetical protein